MQSNICTMIYHNMAQFKKITYTYMYIFDKTYLFVTKYIIMIQNSRERNL